MNRTNLNDLISNILYYARMSEYNHCDDIIALLIDRLKLYIKHGY